MKKTIKRVLQLTLAVALAVSTMLVAAPKASALNTIQSTPSPAALLSVSFSPSTVVEGGSVTATYTVRNIGDAPLPNGYIATVMLPGTAPFIQVNTAFTDGFLAPGASYTITKTFTAPYIHDNKTEVRTGSVFYYKYGFSNSALVSFTLRHPITSIDISATGPAQVYAGNVITYTGTIKNNGDKRLVNVKYGCSLGGGITGIGELDPGASEPFTYSYTVPEDAVVGSTIEAVFTATGEVAGCIPGPNVASIAPVTVSDQDTVKTQVIAKPVYGLSLSMTVDKSTAAAGETVKYMITVTNNSNAPVTGVKYHGIAKLVKVFTPLITLPEQVLDFGDFAVGQTKTQTYTLIIPASAEAGQFFDNFGYASGYGVRQQVVNSNDASARTTVKALTIPEPTVPAGDNPGTLPVTGENEVYFAPIILGAILLLGSLFMIIKSRRTTK